MYTDIDFNTSMWLEFGYIMVEEGFLRELNLLLLNNHDLYILIPKDVGPFIHTYEENTIEWKSITDQVQYYPEKQDIIFPPGDTPTGVTVAFDYPAENLPIEVRIVVVGEVLRDGELTGEKVGAYLDVVVGE